MIAFRVLALAYALCALLIAPSWLAARDAPPPQAPESGEGVPLESLIEPPPAAQPQPAPGAAEEPPVAAAQEGEEQEEPQPAEAKRSQKAPAKEKRPPKEGQPVAKASASASVTIVDFDYIPKTVTVNVGDTVTWTNDGPTPHTATANDGSFDTGLMDEGESGSHTFTQAGTISYICTPHPFMKATVVVKGTTAGSSDPGAAGDPAAAPTGAGGSDAAAASGSGLPATGGETLLIALLGALALAAGLLLRRRADA